MDKQEAINKLLEENFNVEAVEENCELCEGRGRLVKGNKLEYCPKCHGAGYITYKEYTRKTNNFNKFYERKIKQIKLQNEINVLENKIIELKYKLNNL